MGVLGFLKTLNLNQSRNFSGCASDKSLSKLHQHCTVLSIW